MELRGADFGGLWEQVRREFKKKSFNFIQLISVFCEKIHLVKKSWQIFCFWKIREARTKEGGQASWLPAAAN